MWKNILLIPLSMLLGFIVLEATARIWFDVAEPYSFPSEVMVREQRGYWVAEPGFVGTMGNGVDFVDKRISIEKTGGRSVDCRTGDTQNARRLILMGDSQTFGFGLSDAETWASLLSCDFQKDGLPVEVHNFGLPGINIDQYLVQLAKGVSESLGEDDIVMVNVTWNDLHTDQPPEGMLFLEKVIKAAVTDRVKRPFMTTPSVPRSDLAPKTWRYDFYKLSGIFVPSFNSIGEFASSMDYVSVVWREAVLRAKLLYYRMRPPNRLMEKIGAQTFEQNFQMLSWMNDLVLAAGAKMIVHLLPSRMFSDQYYYDAYSASGRNFPEQDFMSYVAKPYCTTLKLNCMSSFDVLHTDARDAYNFPVDGHLNERGAKRVATGIKAFLTERPCDDGGLLCLK